MNSRFEMLKWLGLALPMALVPGTSAGSSVVGGTPITIEEAPYQVLFDMQGVCGASWIGGRWALTAAHCVEANLSGGFIIYGITKESEKSSATTNKIPIKRYIVHPEYKSKDYDIALLEMEKEIVASPKALPIGLVSPADATAGLTAVGKPARLTGWGMDGNEKFPDPLQKLDNKITTATGRAHEIFFAGAQGGTFLGSCSGDSGGPLAVKDASGTKWLQAGIVHGGVGKCGENPGIYTRVSAFYDWINTTTGGVSSLSKSTQSSDFSILSLQGGRIRLSRAENLEISFFDLAGSTVRRVSDRFPAGEIAVPLAGLPSAAFAVRIRGGQGEIACRLDRLR